MMKQSLCLLAVVLLLVSCNSTLTILSTTDTHSQIEPLPQSSNPEKSDKGGYARRMGLIAQERKADKNLLLFDSGDFSQGTPYFNFYKGRIEIDAMNQMGYDAATFGNHEFDNGLDTLAMVIKMANFPFVVANYDVTGTPLEGLIKPWVVIKRGGIRIGVFGVGVAPDDLISKKNFGGIRYLEPVAVINETAALLREQEKCDVVICLSHLGSEGRGVKGHENERDDKVIPQTKGVDVFLSGHTHSMHQDTLMNAENKPVLMVQTGKSGVAVGKTTISLAQVRKK